MNRKVLRDALLVPALGMQGFGRLLILLHSVGMRIGGAAVVTSWFLLRQILITVSFRFEGAFDGNADVVCLILP